MSNEYLKKYVINIVIKKKKLLLLLDFIIINIHTANPEQSGDAKLEGPIRIASCTKL